MSTHFTVVAEKAVLQRKAVLNKINQIWGELEKLEKEVLKSIPEDTSIVDAIQYACVYMMNANIALEASLEEDSPQARKASPAQVFRVGRNRIEEATLDQLLSVLTTIKSWDPQNAEETKSATSFASSLVAKACGIEKNTISDIWVERLNLPDKTRQFHGLAFEWLSGKPDRLCQVIKAHVDEALHSKINDFFRP